MQFKSFMEALRGKQHKIDKNKNGEIDAHDFKLLRKEEAELFEAGPHDAAWVEKSARHERLYAYHTRMGNTAEAAKHKAEIDKLYKKEHTELDEAEQRLARADYKVGTSGRKSHKEIVFNDAESKDDDEEMKEEAVDEAMNKADVPAYLRKKMGEKPLTMADVKAAPKDSISHPDNLAKARGAVKEEAEQLDELSPDTLKSYVNKAKPDYKIARQDTRAAGEAGDDENYEKSFDKQFKRRAGIKTAKAKLNKEEVEQIDERSEQAKRNKIMKNVMSASKGAQINRGLKLDPTEYGYKRAQHLNVAIGRAAMKAEEVKKDDVPFDGPYTKTKPAKNSDGTTQQPMSRARQLAKDAMKKQMKEDIDRLFEKDEKEYGYEGDMAMNQLSTLIRCAEMIKDTLKPDTDLPEWVQSKITLASDYIVTAADYLHSELEEQAPVAPVPDKKYIKGTPEYKAYKASKKPMKESFDSDGNIINNKISYADFALMLEYEAKDGVYRNKGSYGGSYSDPEGADDADDKKPKQQSAEKRGRGRPAGAKSGARKITGTSKLFK